MAYNIPSFSNMGSKMKIKKYTLFCDPGHGWVKVKRSELEKLNIQDKISSYSYQRNDSVYLEEDCDLGIFYDACKSTGIEIELVYKNTNNRSKIRSYESYSK